MASSPHDVGRGPSLEEKDHVLETEVAGAPTMDDPQAFRKSDRVFISIQQLSGKFGVEQRGIERVLPEERTDTSLSKIGTMWLSANMTVSSFAIGALAQPVFNLGFMPTALTIVFVNILGILPVSFFSTFGPRFGLRQMVLSRFYFGYYGVKLIAVFNILACLGWASVNVIVGAQLLASVNRAHPLPGWAGILIIALTTLFITTFGYRIVHAYERWSWLPPFMIFCIVAVEIGRLGMPSAPTTMPPPSAASVAGSVLSFAASVYGFATGWTSFAADFTVYQPEGSSRAGAIFWWTFAGLFLPLVFTELLGAAVMTTASVATGSEGNLYLLDAYHGSGVGGLLAQVLVPPLGGFGRFCVVVLALSIVANNCPNIYSVALSLQVVLAGTATATTGVTTTLRRVPRCVWSLIGTAVYVAISVPGYGMFQSWLENFMLLIGYWLAIYEGVALTEHFVFRRGRGIRMGRKPSGAGPVGYVVEDYDTPSRLPPGIAALGASLTGVLGAVLGMAQVWFTGPLGKLCGGESGGDIGFELAFGFTAVTYLVLRTVERQRFRR